MSSVPAPTQLPAQLPAAPFLVVDCHPCGRIGVWWAGAEFVLHSDVDGTTWGCELPPRDDDHLTARQRAALDVAVRRASRRQPRAAA